MSCSRKRLPSFATDAYGVIPLIDVVVVRRKGIRL